MVLSSTQSWSVGGFSFLEPEWSVNFKLNCNLNLNFHRLCKGRQGMPVPLLSLMFSIQVCGSFQETGI